MESQKILDLVVKWAYSAYRYKIEVSTHLNEEQSNDIMPSEKSKLLQGKSYSMWLAGLLAMGLIAGYGGEPAADTLKEGKKICFACNGTGTIKCTAPGCKDGMVDCPGPCLKLDKGVWVHLNVPGHPSTDLWQKFYHSDHSYEAYNQNHVGHVIVMKNGSAVDTGPCQICDGTGKVPCSVCKGTGKVVCPICRGAKFVPVAWTPTNNPWLNNQPDLIRLKDGRLLFGKIVNTVGTDVTIKTRNGKWVHVEATEIAPKTETISTNAVTP